MAKTARSGTRKPILTELQQSQLGRGLKNLAGLPEFPTAIPGHDFEEEGLIGFRRREGELRITIGCERAEARFLDLAKFCSGHRGGRKCNGAAGLRGRKWIVKFSCLPAAFSSERVEGCARPIDARERWIPAKGLVRW